MAEDSEPFVSKPKERIDLEHMSFPLALGLDLLYVTMTTTSILRRMAVLLRRENQTFVAEIEADIEANQNIIDSVVQHIVGSARDQNNG